MTQSGRKEDQDQDKNKQKENTMLLYKLSIFQCLVESAQHMRDFIAESIEILQVFLANRRAEFNQEIAENELQRTKDYNEALDEYYDSIAKQSKLLNEQQSSLYTLENLEAILRQCIRNCLAALGVMTQQVNNQISSIVTNVVNNTMNQLAIPAAVQGLITTPVNHVLSQFVNKQIEPEHLITKLHSKIVDAAHSKPIAIKIEMDKAANVIQQTLLNSHQYQNRIAARIGFDRQTAAVMQAEQMIGQITKQDMLNLLSRLKTGPLSAHLGQPQSGARYSNR